MMGVTSELEKAAVTAAASTEALAGQLLDEARIYGAAALLSRSGMTAGLMKALAECLLGAELKHHLLHPAAGHAAQDGNCRNGSTPKTVATTAGPIELAIPRARQSTFVPRLVPRYRRSIPGFGHEIIVLYARGVARRELQSRLLNLYGEPAWTGLRGTLTGEVLRHVRAWQERPLAQAWPLVYCAALPTGRPAPGQPSATPCFFALGMQAGGGREVLGFWSGNASWQAALRDLRQRGLLAPASIAGAAAPGLREAAAQVYPGARFRPALP